jgi:hypothetical protein
VAGVVVTTYLLSIVEAPSLRTRPAAVSTALVVELASFAQLALIAPLRLCSVAPVVPVIASLVIALSPSR